MVLIVQKFGGTSLGSIERIKKVAEIIIQERAKGHRVVVIVSAMAGVTNSIVTLCSALSPLKTSHALAEYDNALSTGEVVSAALLSLALQEDHGAMARSFSGWQLPIVTNDCYTSAFTKYINTKLIEECLENNIIPIITGFQGITEGMRITTLGRGGSDTTATLIAAALSADQCEIYTDVAGIYSADPRIVHDARLLDTIYNLEMLEFAASGAKVLHPRSVEVVIRYNIPLRVLSSFESGEGTLITNKKNMEHTIISGITYNKNLMKVLIKRNSNFCLDYLSIIATSGISVDSMIEMGGYDQLIMSLQYEAILSNLLLSLQKSQKIASFEINARIAIVSIVGFGIKNDPEILAQILDKLKKLNITPNILNINEIKISILVEENRAEQCVKLLHELIQTG